MRITRRAVVVTVPIAIYLALGIATFCALRARGDDPVSLEGTNAFGLTTTAESPLVLDVPGTTAGAYFEDTPSTVFHWIADRANLVRFPEAFNAASWGKSQSTITANATIAPDGNLTAGALVDNITNLNTSAYVFVNIGSLPSAVRTVSISMRPGLYQYGFIQGPAGVACIFLLSGAGSVSSPQGSYCTITQEANGFYRLVQGYTTATVNANFLFGFTSAPASINCQRAIGTVGGYVWGAQVVVGPVPLPYQSPPVANLLASPSAFNAAIWSLQHNVAALPVVTPNVAFAPDGTLTADQIDFAAINGAGQSSDIAQSIGSLAVKTGTVWLKAASTACTVYVSMINGAAAMSSAACNAVPNVWTKCPSATLNSNFFAFGPDSLSTGTTQPTTQPACSVYAWGAQATRADQNGDTLVMTGTVPIAGPPTASTFPYGTGAGRAHVGPFSDSNYFTGSSLTLGTSHTICMAFDPFTSANTPVLLNVAGSYVQISGGGAVAYVSGGAPGSVNTVAPYTRNIFCGGENGSNVFAKLNGAATSQTGAPGSPSGAVVIGKYASGGGFAFNGLIDEVWISTTPWTEANVAKIEAAALKQGGPGNLFADDANTILHWSPIPLTTNLVLQSEALNVTWLSQGTCPVTPDQGTLPLPGAAATMDKVQCTGASTDAKYQSITVSASTGPFTYSAWIQAVSGTAIESIQENMAAGAASGCTCTRSDGGACTAAANGAACYAYATVGTTPVHLTVSGVTSVATTTVVVAVHDGQYYSTFNVGGIFGGMQLETSAVANPYVPTTTTALSGQRDEFNNGFVQVGTVPTSTAWVPPAQLAPSTQLARWGYGPFSDANLFTLAAPGPLGFAGDFTCCVTYAGLPNFAACSGLPVFLGSTNGTTTGYMIGTDTACNPLIYSFSSGGSAASTTHSNLTGLNVVCAGRAANVGHIMVNLDGDTTGSFAWAQNTTTAPTLGNMVGGGRFVTTQMLEAWCSTDTPTTASLTALENRALQQTDAFKIPLTTTRNQTIGYAVPGLNSTLHPTLFYAPAPASGNTPLAIGPDGIIASDAATNYALRSEALNNGSWTKTGTVVTADQAVFVDGLTSMELLDSTGQPVTSEVSQGVTVPSSVGPFTNSAWTRAVSGTAIESIGMTFGAGVIASNSCIVTMSDGSAPPACSFVFSGGTVVAYATFGTVPGRISVTATSTVATTSMTSFVESGQWNTSVGTGYFGGVQFEAHAHPTSYMPTAGSTVTRTRDVITYPTNPFGTYQGPFCVDGVVTPSWGRSWASDDSRIFHIGTNATPNQVVLQATGAGDLFFRIIDASSGTKTVTFTHAFAAGSTHRVSGCADQAGGLSLWTDGVSVGAVAGAGTGTLTMSAALATQLLGINNNALAENDASIRNVHFCRGTASACGLGPP